MSTSSENSRRNFFKLFGTVVGFAYVSSKITNIAFAETKKITPTAKPGADAKLVLVDEKSPMAVTLKLYQDGTTVPPTLRKTNAGVEGPKQQCANCTFYSKVSGEKEKEVGKCQLFPAGLVKSGAWCSSWNKKVY